MFIIPFFYTFWQSCIMFIKIAHVYHHEKGSVPDKSSLCGTAENFTTELFPSYNFCATRNPLSLFQIPPRTVYTTKQPLNPPQNKQPPLRLCTRLIHRGSALIASRFNNPAILRTRQRGRYPKCYKNVESSVYNLSSAAWTPLSESRAFISRGKSGKWSFLPISCRLRKSHGFFSWKREKNNLQAAEHKNNIILKRLSKGKT